MCSGFIRSHPRIILTPLRPIFASRQTGWRHQTRVIPSRPLSMLQAESAGAAQSGRSRDPFLPRRGQGSYQLNRRCGHQQKRWECG
ncbi:hypothetical protein GMOD_00006225 [Pyrenophora seminiperda CCB06]|uniref:Uncharacterized protein n=1 Tax=Pyrenophora seminiperda CCB06 TaxID=1302712 RepID=A0A3M7M4U7_9PLEO|nr:hypothetical protein GMOD_00006225 [Pyrenophora seminiperda CCB06]